MIQDRIDSCPLDQLQLDVETSRCVLTVNNQSRHVGSSAYGAVERLSFEDVERVCPMYVVPLGLLAVRVEDDQVEREVCFAHCLTLAFPRVVDMIVMRNSGRDVLETEPRQDAKGSVRSLHQRFVEPPLPCFRFAELAVLSVVLLEIRVRFDRFDS